MKQGQIEIDNYTAMNDIDDYDLYHERIDHSVDDIDTGIKFE